MIILKDYESIKHTHYSSEKKEHSLSWHEMINHKALVGLAVGVGIH